MGPVGGGGSTTEIAVNLSTRQLGDPQESSTRAALDFLAGRVCTPIAGGGGGISAKSSSSKRELLTPARPTAVQHEVPGAF